MRFAARRVGSVPSLQGLLGHTGGRSSQMLLQHGGAPFSPPFFFDLELDAKAASSTNLLDKCFSEMQLQQLGEEGQAGAGSLLQQILMLSRCKSPAEAQLLGQLQRLRTAACAASSSGLADAHQPDAGGSPGAPAGGQQAGEPPGGSCPAPAVRLDVESMACELLAQGYLVQVRDGAAQQQQQQERSKCPRSCLQNLRHRFIVCLGWRSCLDAEPCYLPEPLVLEPRLREQFSIAHPTPEYEALLQSVPACFVGPMANLEAIVRLLCEQMTATFKQQGLPVPPWRTTSALLSKWCPAQLAELAAKIAHLRRLSSDMAAGRALAPCQSHDRLFNDDRPAAAHAAHAAVGSAPSAAAVEGNTLQASLQEPGAQTYARLACPSAGGHEGLPAAAPDGLLVEAAAEPQRPPAGGATTAAQGAACAGHEDRVAPLHGSSAAAAAAVAAADVLALLGPGDAGLGSAGAGTPLKFTRKASAEWKHQRSDSRKIKGLLAAALSTPVGASCRAGMSAAPANGLSEAQAPAAGAQAGPGLPRGSSGAACSGVADKGAAHPAAAAAGAGASDGLIRRTHFRASGDEPWRRITTVRWGAYAQQQAQPQ